MDKRDAKDFFIKYFRLNPWEIQDLEESNEYSDNICVDFGPNGPDGWVTEFNFLEDHCLIVTIPYYEGESIGEFDHQLVDYSDFINYIKENY